jgi:hypothetical protein
MDVDLLPQIVIEPPIPHTRTQSSKPASHRPFTHRYSTGEA